LFAAIRDGAARVVDGISVAALENTKAAKKMWFITRIAIEILIYNHLINQTFRRKR